MRTLEGHIEHPDPGSKFEHIVRQLGDMPARRKIETLQQWGFRAFLGMRGDEMVSYLALQLHEHPLPIGVFRVYRDEAYSHNGVATKTVTAFINDCFSHDGRSRIKISEGNDEKVVKILQRVQAEYAGPHKIRVTPELGRVEKIQ
jgi:hypothetical protein